jgi:hypothetical protein
LFDVAQKYVRLSGKEGSTPENWLWSMLSLLRVSKPWISGGIVPFNWLIPIDNSSKAGN